MFSGESKRKLSDVFRGIKKEHWEEKGSHFP